MINKYKNIVESSLIKTLFGKIKKIIINNHSSGVIQLYDGTEAGVAASSTLTSGGACVPASHGQTELTSSGAMVAGSHAVSVMTGDVIVDGNIMVIGTRTYTFKTTLSNNPSVVDEILIGANLTATLLNALYAINRTQGDGFEGYKYSRGTVANTQVVAVASDATTLTVRGRVPGTSLNTVATTGTALRTVWADTTLGGGTGASDPGVTTGAATVTMGAIMYTIVDELSEAYGATAIPYQVKKGASEATMLDNLKLAVNAGAGAGTVYGTGTVAHPQLIATTNTDTVQTFISRTIGNTAATAAINALATTETMANTAFADTTFGGGTGNSNPAVATNAALITVGPRTYTVTLELSETSGATAVADQILWVTSEAVFLDNFKKAINATGIAGTDYSTGTTENLQVMATTNTDTTQLIVSKTIGTGGNSIATTETMGNYSWTSTVMASGTGQNGRKIGGAITLSAVATTGERDIDLGELAFDNGLYVAVNSGSADLTVVYE